MWMSMLLFLFGFGMVMMLASFYRCGMMLVCIVVWDRRAQEVLGILGVSDVDLIRLYWDVDFIQ